jgi:uracil phosphoribosyltransferase
MNVDFEGSKVGESVAIIPILRAGLAMADGMLELMPKSAVYHIGMLQLFIFDCFTVYKFNLFRYVPC